MFARYLIVLGFILFPLSYSKILKGNESDVKKIRWFDQKNKVYVLQNRVHKKKGRILLNVGVIKGLENDYQDTLRFLFGGQYYWSENFGLGFSYRAYGHSDNNAYELLKKLNGVTPFLRREKELMGVTFLWSPFYGKINTFNQITYFDWYFGAGLGLLKSESNSDSFKNSSGTNTFKSEKNVTFLLKSGLRFYLTSTFDLRVEYLQKVFMAPTGLSEKDLRFKADLNLSVGFSF